MTDSFSIVSIDKNNEIDANEAPKKEPANETRLIWRLDYYQQFFNINTNDVTRRVFSSMVPNRKGFIDVVANNPDLYGPFWICVTLIITASMSGNIAKYINTEGNAKWIFHFTEVTTLASLLFIYTWIVPILLWAFLLWRVGQSNSYSLLSIITLYGYSLSIYIPLSIIWTLLIKFSLIQWFLTLLAGGLSGCVLAISFWPIVSKDRQKIAYIVMFIIIILHATLAIGFQLYFFRSVSNSNNFDVNGNYPGIGHIDNINNNNIINNNINNNNNNNIIVNNNNNNNNTTTNNNNNNNDLSFNPDIKNDKSDDTKRDDTINNININNINNNNNNKNTNNNNNNNNILSNTMTNTTDTTFTTTNSSTSTTISSSTSSNDSSNNINNNNGNNNNNNNDDDDDDANKSSESVSDIVIEPNLITNIESIDIVDKAKEIPVQKQS